MFSVWLKWFFPWLFSLLSLFGLVGCSANWWGGDTAGKRPGFELRGKGLLSGPGLSATADTNATVGKLVYEVTGRDGLTTRFDLSDLVFGQSASAVVKEEPAKLDAIARVQLTQVEYARATWQGIVGLAHEIAPALELLALAQFAPSATGGMTCSFPGGCQVNGQPATADSLRSLFANARNALEAFKATPLPWAEPNEPTTQPAEPSD